MWNLNMLCKLTIVIGRLPCHFTMAKAASSTFELLNSVTYNGINLFNLAMFDFASKCFPIELFPCSDGWRRTWWQRIHIMLWLPFCCIPQCKLNQQDGACLDLFQATGHSEPIFIEANQASNVICNVQSLKSRIKTCSFFGRNHYLQQ